MTARKKGKHAASKARGPAGPGGIPGLPIRAIVHVAREFGSLAGAGGMKDVVEGLCRASAAAGIDTHAILPYYRLIDETSNLDKSLSSRFDVPMNYPSQERYEFVTVWNVRLAENLTLHLVDSHRFRYLMEGERNAERHGVYQYTEAEALALNRPELKGSGYFDFFGMNVLLVKAALRIIGEMPEKPDAVHCHDGHAALLPLIAQTSYEDFDPILAHVPAVLTIHNAGKGYHQELADLEFAATICGIPVHVATACLLDGKFDPLLAGALFSKAVNTVSENYAYELQHTGQDAATGWLGHALAAHGVELVGVTNGVDPESFDPREPARLGLAQGFSPKDRDFSGKEVCKKHALKIMTARQVEDVSLHGTVSYRQETPLLTFISRFEPQKGIDVLAESVEQLFTEDENVQLLGLGTGHPALEARFKELAERFDGRVCVALGYNPALATAIYAAGDFFLVPSRYEPCGLTDFYAQLMGNVPIVHRVGGLVKTVDGRFGFTYIGGTRELVSTIRRALQAYREPGKAALRKIQAAAVRNILENFTWAKIFEKKYLPLYGMAIARSQPILPY